MSKTVTLTSGDVYAKAREVSASEAWERILTETRDRVRFEDGYVAGWFAHKRIRKHQPHPPQKGKKK